MTVPSLSEEQRKLLTEFLGYRYHQYSSDVDSMYIGMMYVKCSCGFKGRLTEWEVMCSPKNRTFTTYQDLGDLFTELQKRGRWEEFYLYSFNKSPFCYIHAEFAAWIFNPDRIGLIAEFVEGETEWIGKLKKP